MRKRNELHVLGEPPEVEKVVERIKATPDNGWKQVTEIEGRSLSSAASPFSTFWFSTPGASDRPAAYVVLQQRGSRELEVDSVISADRQGLTDEQYNEILDRFQSAVLKPAVAGINVEAKIDPFRVKMEKMLSREALGKLKAFSEAADRTSLTDFDRYRWNRFVTQIHTDETALSSEELDWWLRESDWPEDLNRQLGEWYAMGLSLLKEYDEDRAR